MITYRRTILTSIDGVSNPSEQLVAGTPMQIDLSLHSVTELSDVTSAGGGKIMPATEYGHLTDSNAQLSALLTTGSPTFVDVTLDGGSVDDHITSLANPHAVTLQQATDQGNSTSNRFRIEGDSNTFTAGKGLEIAYSSDQGFIFAYDRDLSEYKDIRLQASNVYIEEGNLRVKKDIILENSQYIRGKTTGGTESALVGRDGSNNTLLDAISGQNVQIRDGSNINLKITPSTISTSGILQVDGTGDSYFAGALSIGKTTAAAEALDISGNEQLTGFLQNTNFTSAGQSNWSTGTNYKIWQNGDAEFENLKIRGGLQVYELVINRLRSISGGFLVGPGNGKVESVADATAGSEKLYFEDPSGNTIAPFTAGMIITVKDLDLDATRASGGSGTVLKEIWREVASTDADGAVHLTTTSGWATSDDVGSFVKGDEVIAVGDTGGTYDSNIYMSTTDAYTPWIKLMDGIQSYSDFMADSKTRVHIGNMRNFADYGDTDIYGFFAGQYANSNTFMTVDATSGYRINNLDSGGTQTTPFEVDTDGIMKISDGSNTIMEVDPVNQTAMVGGANFNQNQMWAFNTGGFRLDWLNKELTLYGNNTDDVGEEKRFEVSLSTTVPSQVLNTNETDTSDQGTISTALPSGDGLNDWDYTTGYVKFENTNTSGIDYSVDLAIEGKVSGVWTTIETESYTSQAYGTTHTYNFKYINQEYSQIRAVLSDLDGEWNIYEFHVDQVLPQLEINRRGLFTLGSPIVLGGATFAGPSDDLLSQMHDRQIYLESDSNGHYYVKAK